MYEMRQKSRLTITLPTELLKRVDRLVDGNEVRNRSHAIETLIRKSLKPTVTTAVIIAGGRDKRAEVPLLKKIAKRPLLSIALENLKNYGIAEVIICAGFYEEQIKQVVGDGSGLGVAITYVPEPKPLGTGGAIKKAEAHLQGNPFLVIHGDVLSDINLRDFINFHLREDTLVTLGVKPRMSEENYGQAFLQGNKIIKFMEKGASEGISIVNTGIYIVKPKVLEMIPAGKRTSMEADIFPKLVEMGELSAFVFQGLWYNVSKQQDHKEASERWRKLK